MASKALLDTTLSFGLVTAAVKLKKLSGSEAKPTSLTTASPDGNPVELISRDTVTGAIFGGEDKALLQRGLFTANGFREVPSETMDQINEDTKLDGIEIDGFIDRAEVPWERVVGAYFLAPGGKAGPASAKPLTLLARALSESGKAGFGRLTLRTKTYPFVVYQHEGALYLLTMLYAAAMTNEREAQDELVGVEVDAKAVGMAVQLVESMSLTRTDLDMLHDDRFEQREALIAKVAAGEKIITSQRTERTAAPVDDLAAMLEASVAAASKQKGGKGKGRAKAKAAA